MNGYRFGSCSMFVHLILRSLNHPTMIRVLPLGNILNICARYSHYFQTDSIGAYLLSTILTVSIYYQSWWRTEVATEII